MPPPDQQSIRDAIAREESRLLRLEEERVEAQARIGALKTALDAPRATMAISSAAPSTALEKVPLFRSLFRPRADIYPRFWTNARTGRKGYAPACGNEWVRGICEKPRVKCGECPNQAFLPVEDQVILDHLQGRHVVGVYPLLTDETCWFLAADFAKRSWTDDVAAFVETCRIAGLPAAVERSRSGNGAHVWFLFSAPVAANTARKMGCYLITETMSRRHQLGMESYDRFFPNQDTLPRGGFGNLIALPLQHGPRQTGNTVFVDERSVPYSDQWKFLAEHRRIDPTMVDSVARDATRKGLVVGVRLSDTTDTSSAKDSTTPGSIRSSSRCRSPGRARWCNMRVASTACIPARPRSASTTTSIATSPCSPECSRSACGDIAQSAMSAVRRNSDARRWMTILANPSTPRLLNGKRAEAEGQAPQFRPAQQSTA